MTAEVFHFVEKAKFNFSNVRMLSHSIPAHAVQNLKRDSRSWNHPWVTPPSPHSKTSMFTERTVVVVLKKKT